jgi:hypothetical protein
MNTNLPAIAAKTNSNITHVERIVNHRENRIMKIGFHAAYSQVYNLIGSIFPLYGIDGSKEYYMEVADHIGRNYKLLAPEEIKTAFELFSTQQLDLDEDIKFYGKINLHTLGKILNAYMVYRNKITYQLDKEKQDSIDQQMIDKKRKALTKDYDADFDNKLKTFNKTLEEIPIFWYDECVKRGYINEWNEGEKESLWTEAQEMALNEKPESDSMIDRKNHLRKIEEGNMPRARALAYKLAVWRKVLLRD